MPTLASSTRSPWPRGSRHADRCRLPTAPASCFRPIDFAHDIVAFMDARHIRHATMVGNSFGTLVAQELGLSYPGRADKLVLIGTETDGQSK